MHSTEQRPRVTRPLLPPTVCNALALLPLCSQAFVWDIAGTKLVGRSVSFTATATGKHAVSLTVTAPAADATATTTTTTTTTGSVVSKYVRREVRSLSDEAREATLGAMHALYEYDDAAGQAKYGSRFKSIASFVSKHLVGSASRDCDAWHDGAAFYTHHAAFSLEFELAMQAVDPAVSLPYWDFTVDAHEQAYGDGASWTTSDVFKSDWFGAVGSSRDDRAIDTGKWALTPVLKVSSLAAEAQAKYPVTNPYGLLRSPWNTAASAYVTRGGTTVAGAEVFSGEVPSCKAYASCYASESMAVMNECLNGATHGAVHVQIGGLWAKSLAADSLVSPSMSYELLLITKNLWRQGYVSCPMSCTDDAQSGATCECSLNEAALAAAGSAYEVLTTKTGVLHWVDLISDAISFDDATGKYAIAGVTDPADLDEAWEDLLRNTLASPGHVGEMYTSASPYDPTFWLLHGTADRLVHWRRLTSAAAVAADLPTGKLDTTWGYAHSSVAASDTNLVCDWASVDLAADASAVPSCATGTCGGHLADAVSPFDVSGDGSSLTNEEMFAFLDPTNEALTYTYDSFAWAHCDAEGYAFGQQTDGSADLSYALARNAKATAT